MIFKDYMINESSEFSSLENNPLVYVLIAPRFATCDCVKTIKEDKVLKNAIDKMEKFVKSLPVNTIKQLKSDFRPYSVIDIFKMSNNLKTTFDNYMADFKSIIGNSESNFMKCIDISKKFDELLNSPELITYKNTL